MSVSAVVQPAMAHLMRVWVSLPPGDGDPASGKGPEWGKAAPIGLLIWLFMGLALFFLIKSMNRNLRKVPASFDGQPPSPDSPAVSPDEQDAGAETLGITTGVDGSGGPGGGSPRGT